MTAAACQSPPAALRGEARAEGSRARDRAQVRRSAVSSRSPDVTPIGGEQVAPPEAEPISEGVVVAFWCPPTVLERHLGPAAHTRKRHLDLRAGGWIEAAAPALEQETLARLPHEDRADLRASPAGTFREHSSAAEATLKSKGAWHR